MGIVQFFSISGGELLVVLLFVLLFFGSKGIPDIARTMGRAMRQMRDAGQDVQREINRSARDIKRTVEEQRRTVEGSNGPERPVDDASRPPDEDPAR